MHTIHSVHETGNGDGVVTEIQAHLSNGLPTIQLIGTVGKSLDESKERIRSAFSSCDIEMPRKKITINISPSDLAKNGAHYDVAIALSILAQSQRIHTKALANTPVILGELGLDGTVKPIRGILGKIQTAKQHGFDHFIIPEANTRQASLIPNIHIHPIRSIATLVRHLQSTDVLYTDTQDGHAITNAAAAAPVDLQDIIGQSAAKRALVIAAAGHHNVLLSGPPGVGKSMLAKAAIGILPPLTRDEVITVTHLHSLVGARSDQLKTNRPVRSPHHSSSDVAIVGGGTHPKPGEITLAHTGILFLDELPEFRRATIESLRQPLEDKQVTVSRAKDTTTYPADFILIATKNPCPCGYLGSNKPCTCTPIEIQRYQKKLSGPLLDRIDIHVTMDSIDHTKLLSEHRGAPKESSHHARASVEKVISTQQKRFKTEVLRNGAMTNRDIKQYALLTSAAKALLDQAADKLSLSARVYMKTTKLARTIADLDNSKNVEPQHISEALRYRPANNHVQGN